MLNKTGFVDAAKYGLIILMFLLFIYTSYFLSSYYPIPSTTSYYVFPEVGANAGVFYNRVVTPGEMEAAGWINENTNNTDKFVSDIFGAELIMGMTM